MKIICVLLSTIIIFSCSQSYRILVYDYSGAIDDSANECRNGCFHWEHCIEHKCHNVNGPCKQDADCYSRACRNNKCIYMDECRNGCFHWEQCIGHKCHNKFGPCKQDADCWSRACKNNRCISMDKCRDSCFPWERCYGGKCQNANGPCKQDADCYSRACRNNKCIYTDECRNSCLDWETCYGGRCQNVYGECKPGDECFFGNCIRNGCRGAGRSFIVQGRSRTTSSQTCSGSNLKNPESWKMGEAPLIQASNPYNQEIGRHWLKQAEAEHASVASFARHTLQLMSIGAPSRLLVASQEASVDEIKHAKMCYGFASAFIGSDLVPGSLDVNGSIESMDLKNIIRSLIVEGCIAETLSAIEAHLAAHNAEDTAVKAAVSEIAEDETKHAQLAWDTIKWIIEKYPDSRTFANDIFHVALEQRKTPAVNNSSLLPATLCEDSEKATSFRRYGLLVPGDRDKVSEAGIRDVIEPTYLAGFKTVNMISKRIIELDMATLAHEAGLQDIIGADYPAKFNDVDIISKQITDLDAVTL